MYCNNSRSDRDSGWSNISNTSNPRIFFIIADRNLQVLRRTKNARNCLIDEIIPTCTLGVFVRPPPPLELMHVLYLGRNTVYGSVNTASDLEFWRSFRYPWHAFITVFTVPYRSLCFEQTNLQVDGRLFKTN